MMPSRFRASGTSFQPQLVGHGGHGIPVDGLGADAVQIGRVGFLADKLDEALGYGFFIGHASGRSENIALFHDGGDLGGLSGGELGTIVPVDLIAVILLGVVAGGYVDAGLSLVITDGKGELRRGAQRLKEADMDAVGGHDTGSLTGIILAVEPAVAADHNTALHGLLAALGHHFGKGLGGMADDMDVHAVGAKAHHAAQARGAKGKRGKKAVFDFLVVVADSIELGPFRLAESGAVQPALISFTPVTHFY